MTRLIWKELREKWIWSLLITAAGVTIILMGQSFTFMIKNHGESLWIILPCLVCMLFGASSFSSEIGDKTADFLFSRPVSWKKLTSAKLLTGLVIIILSVIIAEMMFVILCPVQYKPFLTIGNWSKGIAVSLLYLVSAYALGFTASVVLPGAFGG